MAYEIPPETAHFVDREPEQARVFRAAAEWAGQSRPLCVALSGPAGIGRTELAFRLARALRQDPNDDVLHLDLDDLRRDGVVEVADALGDLLRSLGVRPEFLEHSFKARCRQYWTHTDGRRLVVVLDNARYGAEIVPLLPVSAASVVIVVSHGPLHDLEPGAAVELTVSPLDDGHARDLLQRLVADPRLAAEPEAAEGLVRLCSGLPAALHVTGRWLRRHRLRPLSRLLADLTTELHEKGLPEVEAVWDAAYRGLGPDGALLYRLLGDDPGWDFTPQAAIALLGRGEDAGYAALEELDAAGLVEVRGEHRRLSELLRAHARRRARQDGGGPERVDGRRRIVRWYLRQAQSADAVAAGPRLTLAEPVPPVPGAPDLEFADKAAAARWLEAERHALYACVRIAYAAGLDAEAWALCEPLWTHFLDHRHYADVLDAFGKGVAAAQRAGHPRALIRMRCQLARPLWEQGDFAAAERELGQALTAHAALGSMTDDDRKLGASAVEFRGMLHSARGDWAGAAADFEASREVHRAIDNRYGVLLTTYRLGEAVAALGDPAQAAELLEEARDMAIDQNRARMTARTGFALGKALHALGRNTEARPLYDFSLTAARKRGAHADEARILDALAEVATAEGDEAGARAHREAAHTIRAAGGAVE
ncbi:tetratricopeptide repeat protein [Embleya sp. AB8]|uniref:tetratricopeptide repeat protein n=1 Tax=Embleya sp. AB8 TaxID=3156304 RepID=UPI003C735939